MSDEINFDDIKWGSFTKQFETYNRTASKKMKDLSAFARMILDAPKDKFSDTTRKRANFYLNVLAKKGKTTGGARTWRVSQEWLRQFFNDQYRHTPTDRRLYSDELQYVRRLFRNVRLPPNTTLAEYLPITTTLYGALQKIIDKLSKHYNIPEHSIDFWNWFNTILMEWEENTGLPLLVLPKHYRDPTYLLRMFRDSHRDVVDLTQPEVVDLTGGVLVKPHIVRPFFSMG